MSAVEMRNGEEYALKDVLGEVKMYSEGCSHWLNPLPHKEGHVIYGYGPCYAQFVGLEADQRSSLYIGLRRPRAMGVGAWGSLCYIKRVMDVKEGYQRWLEWLVERSPHWEAIEQGQEWGYSRFVKMNVSATGHLVHHAACALRIHQEHEYVPLYWMLYTHEGMEEDMAYLMALMTAMEDGDVIRARTMVSHSALSTAKVCCLAGFLLRGYDRTLPSWEENSHYTGHGSMWTDGREGEYAHEVFAAGVLFPPPVVSKTSSPFDMPRYGTYPLTKRGVAEFVEKVGVEMPRLLRVKLIDNPKPNGVKYEKA